MRSVTYLRSYTLKSFINLAKPENNIHVVTRDPYAFKLVPELWEIQFRKQGQFHVEFEATYPGQNPDEWERIKGRPKFRPPKPTPATPLRSRREAELLRTP